MYAFELQIQPSHRNVPQKQFFIFPLIVEPSSYIFFLSETLETWIAHINDTLSFWRPAINSGSEYPICISIEIEKDKNTAANLAPPLAPNLLYLSRCPCRPLLHTAEISLSAHTTLTYSEVQLIWFLSTQQGKCETPPHLIRDHPITLTWTPEQRWINN